MLRSCQCLASVHHSESASNGSQPRVCASTIRKMRTPGRASCVWLGKSFWASSCFLLIATTACYIGLWDSVAALTVFPQWGWAAAGGIAGYASWRICGWHRKHLILGMLWLGSVLFFSDNLIPMLKSVRGPVDADRPPCIRVITLNCAGKLDAALEAAALKPDILLLQEIPSNSLALVAASMGAGTNAFICGYDCAILVKGRITRAQDSFPPQHIQGRVELQGDIGLFVTSLRLVPPEGRIDLWNPRCWQQATENRRLRRAQLQATLPDKSDTDSLPEVLGGDFNAPVSDSAYRLLTRYEDAHRKAGKGWGNTVLNSFPIARPDQIRVRDLKVLSAKAVPSSYSDHRMVIAEFTRLRPAP